jgi:hypothetical protein
MGSAFIVEFGLRALTGGSKTVYRFKDGYRACMTLLSNHLPFGREILGVVGFSQ